MTADRIVEADELATGTALAILPPSGVPAIPLVPEEIFKPKGTDPLLKQIEDIVAQHVPDVTTDAGRTEIKRLGRKIASSKSYLDGLGKDLVAELKERPKLIDAERKRMRDHLEALQAKIMRPYEDWQAAEAARVNRLKDRLASMEAILPGLSTRPSVEIEDNFKTLDDRYAGDWEDFADVARETFERVHAELTRQLPIMKKYESDQAELEALRKQKEERDRKDAEEKRQREAEEHARIAAQQAKEKAERDAAAAIKAESERAARAEEQAAQAKADAERRAAEAAEAAAKKERDRIEAEQRAEAEDRRRRETDREHRAAINRGALDALVKIGLTSEQGMAVLNAIAKGMVPNVSINY